MFSWLNKQGVQSDRGFVVQCTGRFTAEYRDGEMVVTFAVESGINGGMPCIILDPDAFRRWDNGVAIPPSQQAQLFENVREAMEFQRMKMVIEQGR